MRAISWVTGMESMERWGGKADILAEDYIVFRIREKSLRTQLRKVWS